MSHTSTYRSDIRTVRRDILDRTMQVLSQRPGLTVVEQASGYRGRGGVFDYAVQPVGRGCFLGLGIRVKDDGSLEFGEDTSDRHILGSFLEKQRQGFLQTYASALLMEAAALCGYQPEVLQEGVGGEASYIALNLAR